jgi:nitrogen fixation protein FixH
MGTATSSSSELTGRHVLAIFVGFFAVVFAVNGYFIVSALSTHSGVVANEPYRKGLHYNERIAADAAQAELGWTSQIALDPASRRLKVVLKDRSGQPVTRQSIKVTFGRPATTQGEQILPLAETGLGVYEAAVRATERGAYVASIQVDGEAAVAGTDPAPLYRAKRRLWLAP